MTSDNNTTKGGSTPDAARTPSEGTAKLEESVTSNYNRGENQKPVTGSYKDNWNRIFGKKKTKQRR